MPYPVEMQDSIKNVAATRQPRLNREFPRLESSDKKQLLENYHPDYRPGSKKAIPLGPNKGELVPIELADLIKSPSRLNPAAIELEKNHYHTDVLVIGGGGGGATAALSAKKTGAQVLLVTKLRLGDSNTTMAEGGIGAATLPEDSPAIHWIDTMVGGRFQNKADLVEALVTDAPFIVDWLTNLGVNFDRNADGSYETHMPGGHSRRRSHSVKDLTGLEIMRVLADEIRNREIEVLEFSPAVELLLDEDQQCAGAVLLNLDTGQHFVVEAKTTIVCTGGMGRLHPNGFPTSNHYGATADGIIMAYRAGAKLLHPGYVQYHPTGAAWPEQMLGLLISEALRAQHAQLVNKHGQMFINRLETRDAVASAIIQECGEKNNGVVTPTGMVGVWLDTPLIDIICGQGTFLRRFAGIYKRFKKYDIDPINEPILIYPTQHYQNGGVEINTNGETNVPNLYMAGEVSGGVHGHNRLGSNSLQDIFVFGRRAGRHAAEKSRQVNLGKLSLDHVKAYNTLLQENQIETETVSPLILPDYRFEKALTKIQHIEGS
ncbi:MAG: FAD-binding protein [Desulfobacterales bacterium]|nr:MAG: FAD-binding protein [Desulfobacterales bacterium]